MVKERKGPGRTGVPCLNRKSVKGGWKVRLDGWKCSTRGRGRNSGEEPHFSAIGRHMSGSSNIHRTSSCRVLAAENEASPIELIINPRFLPQSRSYISVFIRDKFQPT